MSAEMLSFAKQKILLRIEFYVHTCRHPMDIKKRTLSSRKSAAPTAHENPIQILHSPLYLDHVPILQLGWHSVEQIRTVRAQHYTMT